MTIPITEIDVVTQPGSYQLTLTDEETGIVTEVCITAYHGFGRAVLMSSAQEGLVPREAELKHRTLSVGNKVIYLASQVQQELPGRLTAITPIEPD